MANTQKTVIVTGASQGIGAAVVRAFLERGYNVVGTSRNATKSAELKASDKLVLVDGDIGQAAQLPREIFDVGARTSVDLGRILASEQRNLASIRHHRKPTIARSCGQAPSKVAALGSRRQVD